MLTEDSFVHLLHVNLFWIQRIPPPPINGLAALLIHDQAVGDVKGAIPDQNSTLTAKTRRSAKNNPALLSDRAGFRGAQDLFNAILPSYGQRL